MTLAPAAWPGVFLAPAAACGFSLDAAAGLRGPSVLGRGAARPARPARPGGQRGMETRALSSGSYRGRHPLGDRRGEQPRQRCGNAGHASDGAEPEPPAAPRRWVGGVHALCSSLAPALGATPATGVRGGGPLQDETGGSTGWHPTWLGGFPLPSPSRPPSSTAGRAGALTAKAAQACVRPPLGAAGDTWTAASPRPHPWLSRVLGGRALRPGTAPGSGSATPHPGEPWVSAPAPRQQGSGFEEGRTVLRVPGARLSAGGDGGAGPVADHWRGGRAEEEAMLQLGTRNHPPVSAYPRAGGPAGRATSCLRGVRRDRQVPETTPNPSDLNGSPGPGPAPP
ncbi:PREDICTED: translation initiation factor IF-2-like [Chinchilla lanigera]|uniref:translation initiation factor IF-2-like n=1 Tax=Chinchilla lanigera TaxID=34839 RepID=UPI000696A373|nr:PREDICTED: translation initiation factor IF-2-like [Chinchilla lanigera]